MAETETTGKHAVQGQSNINQAGSSPPQRRRRSRKKKKPNFKKYVEWLMWAIMIIIFLVTITMLFRSASVKDSGVKKKGSAADYHSPWPAT